MFVNPSLLVVTSVISFLCLLIGQTGGTNPSAVSFPNIANLTAVVAIGYVQIHLVCRTLPAVINFLTAMQEAREKAEARHKEELDTARDKYLNNLNEIMDVVRNCEFRKAEK